MERICTKGRIGIDTDRTGHIGDKGVCFGIRDGGFVNANVGKVTLQESVPVPTGAADIVIGVGVHLIQKCLHTGKRIFKRIVIITVRRFILGFLSDAVHIEYDAFILCYGYNDIVFFTVDIIHTDRMCEQLLAAVTVNPKDHRETAVAVPRGGAGNSEMVCNVIR